MGQSAVDATNVVFCRNENGNCTQHEHSVFERESPTLSFLKTVGRELAALSPMFRSWYAFQCVATTAIPMNAKIALAGSLVKVRFGSNLLFTLGVDIKSFFWL